MYTHSCVLHMPTFPSIVVIPGQFYGMSFCAKAPRCAVKSSHSDVGGRCVAQVCKRSQKRFGIMQLQAVSQDPPEIMTQEGVPLDSP